MKQIVFFFPTGAYSLFLQHYEAYSQLDTDLSAMLAL